MFEKIKLAASNYLLKSALKSESTGTGLPFVSFVQQRLGNYLYGSTNEAKYLSEYRGWVYACVTARANAVKGINWRLFRNDTELDSHELLDLLYTVNPNMTKTQLVEATEAFLDLDGNAFWFLDRPGVNHDQKPKAIYVVRPDRMKLITAAENPLQLSGYVYITPDGTKVPFSPNEILHFKRFNPMGEHPYPHRGIGIVQAAAFAIETDNEAKEWNLKFFKNSALPGGVLQQEGAGKLGDADYVRIRREWEQNHQGSDNAFKIAILGGGLKWQEVMRSQKDMDFVQQRQASRDEILAMFSVPKTAIGIVEDVNRANAEATNFVFADRTVKPEMDMLTDFIQEYLVPMFDPTLVITNDSPVPEDKEADLNYADKGVDRWITRNEIRAKMGLDPIPGGDILTAPLAVQEIGTAQPAKRVGQARTKAFKSGYRAKRQATTTDAVITEKLDKFFLKKKSLTPEAKSNYIKQWKTLFDINEDPLKKDLKKYFNKQEKEVLANLSKVIGKKDIDADIQDILPDDAVAIETAITLISKRIQQYIDESGGQAMQLTGSGLTFDNATQTIADFVESRSEFFASSITETTNDELFTTLSEGLKAGESAGQLSERVATVYGQARDYRTDRIARTEISAAANFGSQEAYHQAGVEKWQWVVVDPQDDDCLVNEDEIVVIGDAFTNGDTMPPVHPNCQCTTIPIFD